MNILLVTAEAAPFAKAGGLADIAQSLPLDWQKFGQNPIVMMPKYGFIDVEYYEFKPLDMVLFVPMGYWMEFGRLWSGFFPGTKVPVYLIEHDEYFNRSGIYGSPDEYIDNDRRFIFFSRAIFEAAKALNFSPDIIHAHDYHTAFTMAFLKSQYRLDPLFSRTAGVYTIHNLAYQGWFDPARAMEFSTFGLKEFYTGSWFEHFGKVNAMKVGLMFSDKITTVSPTYAKEIRIKYFSEGLQDILNLRAADLIGILNGVYYDEWSPEVDDLIYSKYDSEHLYSKHLNKISYLKQNGLTESDNLELPLVGMVTRLTEQKGVDIIMDKLEEFIANGSIRFTILGSGEKNYIDFFNYLGTKYPDKVIIYIGYNNSISHRIQAASDFLIMPSRFEPCGLTQMYALKYGTIPIVRATGGLADTVFEYNYATGAGTGFSFWNYSPDDFSYALRRAISLYQTDPHWDLIRKNAMSQDFSSSRSALEYLKVFKWSLEKIK